MTQSALPDRQTSSSVLLDQGGEARDALLLLAMLPMETLPEAGERFKALRRHSGKTQEEVAAAVGMRQEALSRFENGRGADFSLAKFLRLFQVLGMSAVMVPATKRPTLNSVLAERRINANVGPSSR